MCIYIYIYTLAPLGPARRPERGFEPARSREHSAVKPVVLCVYTYIMYTTYIYIYIHMHISIYIYIYSTTNNTTNNNDNNDNDNSIIIIIIMITILRILLR